MLRQRLTPTILGMRPPGFSVILPPPKKETQWISLDNQALFSQHFGGFFHLERCKHLWYRKAAQSGPVSC